MQLFPWRAWEDRTGARWLGALGADGARGPSQVAGLEVARVPQGRTGSLVPSANPPPALSFGPVSVPWALPWGPTVPGAGLFGFVLESGTLRSPRVQGCWRTQVCRNVSGFPRLVIRRPGVLGRSPPGLPSSGPAGRALQQRRPRWPLGGQAVLLLSCGQQGPRGPLPSPRVGAQPWAAQRPARPVGLA